MNNGDRDYIEKQIATNEEVIQLLVELMDNIISLAYNLRGRGNTTMSAIDNSIDNIFVGIDELYKRHDRLITEDTYNDLKDVGHDLYNYKDEEDLLIHHIDRMVSIIHNEVAPDLVETIYMKI